MASNSKTLAELLNGDVTVTATDIADGAVSTAKIADDAVTVAKVADQVIGRKNLIINGAMQVAQRGTSLSRTSSNIAYTLDRMISRSNSSTNHTVTQETDAPTGFTNSMKVVRDSGQTGALIRIETPLETKNITQLRGQKATLSFYAKKDSGATDSDLSVFLYTGDGTEGDRSITAYDNEVVALNGETATLTTSWQRFEFTTSSTLITDLSQLAVQIQYSGVGTAPSNDGFFFTGLQLEVGDTATPFEHRSYGEELALCERYFQVLADHDNSNVGQFMAMAHTTTIARAFIQLRHQMRAAPSIETSSSISNSWRWTGAGQNKYNSTIDFHSSSPTFFGVTNPDGTFSVGALHLFTNASGAYLYADAEL